MTQPNPLAQAGRQQQQPPADEFEIMRQRLRQRGAVRGEEAQRQLQRQSAALGNLPSGAALRLQQQAARETERLTGEQIQDVNILQAQTQRAEREAAAQRELQRFGITTQAGTALQTAQIGAQAGLEQARIGARAGLEQARIGARSALETTRLDVGSRQAIAQLGATSDFEIAQLQGAQQLEALRQQGANEQELATLQNQLNTEFQEMQNVFEEKRIGLLEGGMNKRLADQIASNEKLFKLEMIFKEKGQSIQERLTEANIDATRADTKMSQLATMTNMLDPLFALGFELDDVHGLMNNLDTPFSDEIAELARVRHNELRRPGQQVITPSGQSVSPTQNQNNTALFNPSAQGYQPGMQTEYY